MSSETHINLFVTEVQNARTAIDGAINEFKTKVLALRAKAVAIGTELESLPEVQAAITAIEKEYETLTGETLEPVTPPSPNAAETESAAEDSSAGEETDTAAQAAADAAAQGDKKTKK